MTPTTRHLKKGTKICLTCLGILQVRKRAARMGRNPATGEAIKIKASEKMPSGQPKNSKRRCNPPARRPGWAAKTIVAGNAEIATFSNKLAAETFAVMPTVALWSETMAAGWCGNSLGDGG